MTHHPHALPPTRLDVSDLLDAPGATRQVDVDVPLPEGFEVPLTTLHDPLRVEGVLESLVDGVLLRGTVHIGLDQQCASCLEPVDADHVLAPVAELFNDPADLEHPEDLDPGYEIADSMIDIETLLRDTLAAAVPTAPHCRPDCAGLCPSCGVNLNHQTCECRDEVVDDRWAALADLDLGT